MLYRFYNNFRMIRHILWNRKAMITMPKEKRITRVAIPYYGPILLPCAGIEKVYYVADVDKEQKKVLNIELMVWDHKDEAILGDWLKEQRVEGIISSDVRCVPQVGLEGDGIWIYWGQTGDITEIINRFAKGEITEPLTLCSKMNKNSHCGSHRGSCSKRCQWKAVTGENCENSCHGTGALAGKCGGRASGTSLLDSCA
jgi:predicted Fe-Mo cluster-binding NifX family protein